MSFEFQILSKSNQCNVIFQLGPCHGVVHQVGCCFCDSLLDGANAPITKIKVLQILPVSHPSPPAQISTNTFLSDRQLVRLMARHGHTHVILLGKATDKSLLVWLFYFHLSLMAIIILKTKNILHCFNEKQLKSISPPQCKQKSDVPADILLNT